MLFESLSSGTNLKHFAHELPVQPCRFDARQEISARDWAALAHYFHTEVDAGPEARAAAACLRVIHPDACALLEFSAEDGRTLSDTITYDLEALRTGAQSPAGCRHAYFLAAPFFVPNLQEHLTDFSYDVEFDEEWEGGLTSAAEEGDWQDFAQLTLKAHLLRPYRMSELPVQESMQALKQDLAAYDESQIDMYTATSACLRTVFPASIDPLTPERLAQAKRELQRYRLTEQWHKFSELALHLHILAAENLRIEEGVLHVTPVHPLTNVRNQTLPVTKNFHHLLQP